MVPVIRAAWYAEDASQSLEESNFFERMLVWLKDWDDITSLQRDFASPAGKQTAQDVEELARLTSGVQSYVCRFEEV